MPALIKFDRFFQQAALDSRLTTSHISIFLFICFEWCSGGSQKPVSITAHYLMPMVKINSKATYYKCIRELHRFGYIHYHPSNRNSYVSIPSSSSSINEPPQNKSSSINEPLANDSRSINEPLQNPQKASSNNVINKKSAYNPIDQPPVFNLQPVQKLNNIDICNHINNNITVKDIFIEKISKEKKKKNEPLIPPNLQECIGVFIDKNCPALEAEKFFNYYQSNGWQVGKNPMKNWQAAARYWILNIPQFAKKPNSLMPTAGKLQAPNVKNYSEPL